MKFTFLANKQRGSVELAVIAATSAITLVTLLSSVFTVNKQSVQSNPQVLAATTVNLNPTADAMVRQEAATTNYGTITELTSKGTDFRAIYIKFNLSTLAGKTITSAKLRLKTTSDGGSGNTHSIKLISNTSWTESGI